jgi:ribosomal protein L37AE/L43A
MFIPSINTIVNKSKDNSRVGIVNSAKTKKKETLKCSSCGSKDVRRSQMRGLLESILKVVGVHAYRCEDCDRRFYGTGQLKKSERGPG